MTEEPELVMSSLCQTVERDCHTVRVEIYGSGKSDWILEVVNEAGDSIECGRVTLLAGGDCSFIGSSRCMPAGISEAPRSED